MNIEIDVETLHCIFKFREASKNLEKLMNLRYHKNGIREEEVALEKALELKNDCAYELAEYILEDFYEPYIGKVE